MAGSFYPGYEVVRLLLVIKMAVVADEAVVRHTPKICAAAYLFLYLAGGDGGFLGRVQPVHVDQGLDPDRDT